MNSFSRGIRMASAFRLILITICTFIINTYGASHSPLCASNALQSTIQCAWQATTTTEATELRWQRWLQLQPVDLEEDCKSIPNELYGRWRAVHEEAFCASDIARPATGEINNHASFLAAIVLFLSENSMDLSDLQERILRFSRTRSRIGSMRLNLLEEVCGTESTLQLEQLLSNVEDSTKPLLCVLGLVQSSLQTDILSVFDLLSYSRTFPALAFFQWTSFIKFDAELRIEWREKERYYVNQNNGFSGKEVDFRREYIEVLADAVGQLSSSSESELGCNLRYEQVEFTLGNIVMQAMMHPASVEEKHLSSSNRSLRAAFIQKELRHLCQQVGSASPATLPLSASTLLTAAESDPLRRFRLHRRSGSAMDEVDAAAHVQRTFDTTNDDGAPAESTNNPFLATTNQELLARQYGQFHALAEWLASSLALIPSIGPMGVTYLPVATDAEIYGFLNAFNSHSPPGQDLEGEFKDVLIVQKAEYLTFGKFFLWIEISNILYSIRDEAFVTLNTFQIHRMQERMKYTYREDLNFMNFSPMTIHGVKEENRNNDGELYRMILLKWRLEYVNEIADLNTIQKHMDSLGRLKARLNSTETSVAFRAKLTPGLLQFYYSTLIQNLAHFRLNFIYESSIYLFDHKFMEVWKDVSSSLDVPSPLTVEWLTSIPSDSTTGESVQQLLQRAFQASMVADTKEAKLLNQTLSALDIIEEEYTQQLINNIVSKVVASTAGSETPQAHSTMHNLAAAQDESFDSAAIRLAQVQIASVPLPEACSITTPSPVLQAACTAFRAARTLSTHGSHIRALIRYLEGTMASSSSSSLQHESSFTMGGRNLMSIVDASRSMDALNSTDPSLSVSQLQLSRFNEILSRVLIMQSDLVEPWMLRDVASAANNAIDAAELKLSANQAVDQALTRLYALATKSVELGITSHQIHEWSSWMLILSKVHPSVTLTTMRSLDHTTSKNTLWTCSEVEWNQMSSQSFEALGIFHRALSPATHSILAPEYRRSHFNLFSANEEDDPIDITTITDISDGVATDEDQNDIDNTFPTPITIVNSKTIFSTLPLHRILLRVQLQAILDASHISNVDFQSETFLKQVIEDPRVGGHLSSLQILVERLQTREADNAKAFALDAPKSWHSDRTKSPSASYDFTLSTSYLDLLVYLDTLVFSPLGHLYLKEISHYHTSQIALITRKINAGDKDLLENRYREIIPASIWLAGTNDFEKWRWSWPQDGSNVLVSQSKSKYPEALELISSPGLKNVAQSWTDLGVTSNIMLACLIATIATAAYTLIEILRLLIVKPWKRPSLVLNGTIEHEEAYHKEYEARERRIVWRRNLPLKLLLNLCTNFLLCTFSLTLNWSYFSPVAVLIYVCIFSWLTSIIIDVYFLKYFIYLTSLFLMPYVDFALKQPICTCCIPTSKSLLILNPLRPVSEEQLRNVVSKNVDLLWGCKSSNIISVLILQCIGNQTSTYRTYERIIRDMIYDNTEVPSHVKNRFFVFQMGGISKPHNMYKVMRWFFAAQEEQDPVTKNFLYGIQTHWKLSDHPQMIRRVPEGESLPLFLQVGEAGTKIQIEVDSRMQVGSAASAVHDEEEKHEQKGWIGSDQVVPVDAAVVNGLSTPKASSSDASASKSPTSPFTQASAELSFLHCDGAQMKEYASRTYEPLVYLGGAANSCKGVVGQGADAGILATPGGLKVLESLRNESTPGSPLLENFLVLDADNYVEPVTLLRMINTMTDAYLIWQPSINFYNSSQSMYAYIKNYANLHLGNIMNTSNTLMLGGVRSFGKYFGRLKRYYYEECTSSSSKTSASHYPALYSLCAYLLTFTLLAFLVRPMYWEVTVILLVITPLAVIFTIALTIWSHNLKPDEVSPISSRYQSMFPLNRMFIQSEDARHGGPFGRAAFIMDDQIHEATPPCPIDDSKRENTKWMPTFDMRDWILLHTPLLWILSNLRLSLTVTAVLSALSLIFTIISWQTYDDGFMHAVLALSCIIFGVAFLMILSLYRVATQDTLRLVKLTRLPEMPERAEYAEALVSRGVFGEAVWAVQFLLGLSALLFPGTIEVAFPFLGESHLLFIIILLVHPKFSGAFLTRLHRILRPRYQGFWKMMPAQVEEKNSPGGMDHKHQTKQAVGVGSSHQNVSPDRPTGSSTKREQVGVELEMQRISHSRSPSNDSEVDEHESMQHHHETVADEQFVHTTLFVDPSNPRDLYCGRSVLPQQEEHTDKYHEHEHEEVSVWRRICCCASRHRALASDEPIFTMPVSPAAKTDITVNAQRRKSDANNNAARNLPGHTRTDTASQLLPDEAFKAMRQGSDESESPAQPQLPDEEERKYPPPPKVSDVDATITVSRMPSGNPMMLKSLSGDSGAKSYYFGNKATQLNKVTRADEPSRMPMSTSHASSSAFPNPYSNFYAEQRAILQQQQQQAQMFVGSSPSRPGPRGLRVNPSQSTTDDMILPFSPVGGPTPHGQSGAPWVVRVESTPSHALKFFEGDHQGFFGDNAEQMAEWEVEETPIHASGAASSAWENLRGMDQQAARRSRSGSVDPTNDSPRPRGDSVDDDSPVLVATRIPSSKRTNRRGSEQKSDPSSETNSPALNTLGLPPKHTSPPMTYVPRGGLTRSRGNSRRGSAERASPNALGVPPLHPPSADSSPPSAGGRRIRSRSPVAIPEDVMGMPTVLPSAPVTEIGAPSGKNSGTSSLDHTPFVPVRPRLLRPSGGSVTRPLGAEEAAHPLSMGKLITLTPPTQSDTTELRPLTEAGTTALQSQLAFHAAMVEQKAALVTRRKYIVQRERRRDLIRDLIIMWPLHDIPVGFFEFAASTSVFLVKIVSKPFQVLWAFLGVYLEIRGLLAAVPVSGTWPSFEESEETLPLSAYIDEYSLPMAAGIGVLILCLPGLTSNIMQIPGFQQYLFSPMGLFVISLVFAVVLGCYPAWKQLQTLKYTLRRPVEADGAGGVTPPWWTYYEWHRLMNFSTLKMVLSLLCSCGVAAMLLLIGILAYALSGMIPSIFFVRSFPILVSSFLFGPAIGFLVGKVNGAIDGTTNPPSCRGSEWTRRLVVGMGWMVALLSAYFVYFFTKMLLPVQALGMHGPTTPTGDGAMSMMLPFTLSYNEMLKAPWYFVIPYASIVYGGLFVGTVAWIYGLAHQTWISYKEYKDNKEFQREMAKAAVEVAQRMVQVKGVEEVETTTKKSTPKLTAKHLPERAAIKQFDLSTVREAEDSQLSERDTARSTIDRPTVTRVPSPVPTIKVETPYINLTHMRVKEAQYRRELEEQEEAQFTPQMFNRPRLFMNVQREDEQIPILPSPMNQPSASGPMRERSAWVQRGTPSAASSNAISEFLSDFSPSNGGNFVSPLGLKRQMTLPGAASTPRHDSPRASVPSYLASTPRHTPTSVEGSDDPHHATNIRAMKPGGGLSRVFTPSSRQPRKSSLVIDARSRSATEHDSLTDELSAQMSPEIIRDVDEAGSARLHLLGQSLKSVFGASPGSSSSSGSNVFMGQVSRVQEDFSPSQLPMGSPGLAKHGSLVMGRVTRQEDPSAGIFARGVATRPIVRLDRSATTSAAVARKKGGFDYAVGSLPANEEKGEVMHGLERVPSFRGMTSSVPRGTHSKFAEPDEPPPPYSSRPSSASTTVHPTRMEFPDHDSTPEVSRVVYQAPLSTESMLAAPSRPVVIVQRSTPSSSSSSSSSFVFDAVEKPDAKKKKKEQPEPF